MEIRQATEKDVEALVDFNQAMALETEGKTLDPEILATGVRAVFSDSSKGFYVVAENDGSLIGGLMVTTEWSDWRNSWFWWIQSVYILPTFRGHGIYSQLYDFVKTRAQQAGNVCGFRLYVEKENNHAQRVYQAVGMNESYYLMYEEGS